MDSFKACFRRVGALQNEAFEIPTQYKLSYKRDLQRN